MGGAEADIARQSLKDHFVSLAPVFGDMPFFLSEEFSLVDCSIAPLLWRLPSLGIELPLTAKAVTQYGERMFKRASFQACITDPERELRDKHVA